jgi:hypothetical protein
MPTSNEEQTSAKMNKRTDMKTIIDYSRDLNNFGIDEQLITFGAIIAFVVSLSNSETIMMTPIGYVKRESAVEDERDRTIITRIVFEDELAPALTEIDE